MGAAASLGRGRAAALDGKALIAITLDLEMSRHYPKRGMMEWDYEKGNLDAATKKYAVEAGRLVKERGGRIHYFCVGRVLEQPDVGWLKGLVAAGHKVGNHTYDHVNVKAKTPAEAQFRFARPVARAGKDGRTNHPRKHRDDDDRDEGAAWNRPRRLPDPGRFLQRIG